MFQIESRKVQEFYKKNIFLDFNSMNELFVDILQKMIDNLNKNIDKNEVQDMLRVVIKNIGEVRETMNENNKNELIILS